MCRRSLALRNIRYAKSRLIRGLYATLNVFGVIRGADLVRAATLDEVTQVVHLAQLLLVAALREYQRPRLPHPATRRW